MAGEEQYVVEKIVDKRTRRGVAQYLIKWTGCDESENTWEPEQNLKCDVLLQQFLQERAAQPKKRGRRSTQSLPSDGEQMVDSPVKTGSVEKRNDEKPPTTIGVGQEKVAQSSKRARRSTRSLPSDSEPVEEPEEKGSEVKVEKHDEKPSAVIGPKRKLGKKSLDSSKEQSDQGRETKPEEKVAKKRATRAPRKQLAEKPSQGQSDGNGNEGDGLNGFDRGYVAESLVGITQEGDTFLFLVKWQGQDEMEMVSSKEVRKYAPEMVIDFYENRIIWNQKKEAMEQRT